MLKLHGFKLSNYTFLAKACLLEKGIEYENVEATPSQETPFLERSPMGKVPTLETDQGFVSEVYAIADYLDHIQPEPALLPADPFERAKAIELIRHIELDVELVARRCLPAAMFGATASEETLKRTEKDLRKGLAAVSRLIECNPYATGSEFNLADLYTYYSFGLTSQIAQKLFGLDILAEVPGAKELMTRLAERDSIKSLAYGLRTS
jgi:glutathione S-transferase